jgi:hypothetical protein
MKRSLVWLICLLSFSAAVAAQSSETFDIATFRIPAGWTRVNKDGVVFLKTADTKKGTFALISLFASDKSTGDPVMDFNNDWKQFVQGQLGVKGNAQMEPAKSAGGWQINTGGAAFESSDLGKAVVLMNTFSGFGRAFSMTAVFNSQDDIAAMEGFLSSLNLTPPAAEAPAAVAAPAAGNVDASILGTWGSNVGATMTYGDPVAAGMAGYTKSQYTLNADGTYIFNSKTFRMSYDKIILVRESGTYQINGGTLTIKPQKSVIQAWSKLNGVDRFGRLLTSQNRKLEPVTYRYTKHYFSGIQEWNLVLQADSPTERDGPFSTFTLFPNAWYYKGISSNNPIIELPQ